MPQRFLLLCLTVGLSITAMAQNHPHAQLAHAMSQAAQSWLDSLDEEQIEAAQLPANSRERTNWHYVPLEREGLAFKDMKAVQRGLALRLLHTALSDRGSLLAVNIMQLESVLRELENGAAHRDPELYYVTVFGDPNEPVWGWRFEGHHLSVNQTITPDGIYGTPLFMGANPARVPHGPKAGQRILGESEDLARAFLLSLSSAQRDVAIVRQRAHYEILTEQEQRVSPLSPRGLPWTDLNADQQAALKTLVQHYVERHESEIAATALERIENHGLENLTFAWAGPIEVGEAHYYRVQGPTFVIEYANTQNNANHHHTVFRDFEQDFGRDSFREHYRTQH